MEIYYSLGEFKSKGLNVFNKEKELKKEPSKLRDDFKSFITPKNLIKEGIVFTIEEDAKMMLNEASLNKLLSRIKEVYNVNMEPVKEKLSEIEYNTATPVVFDNFQEFIDYQNPRKREKQLSDGVEKFIMGKFKTRKAFEKEKSRIRKEKKATEFNKKVIDSFKEETVFMSIDFECLYSDNNVPVEVGYSLFSFKNTFENAHVLFEETLEESKKQPKKFKKSDHFAYGETIITDMKKTKELLDKAISKADHIVCHASQLERKMLKKLGVEFESSAIIDSQLWFKTKKGEKQVRSLERIAEEYGMNNVKFHNSGNDAVVTGLYFRELIKEQRPELFMEKEKPKPVKKEMRRRP